ncbi:MAG: glutathione S-transferase family protein [Deltaproteobacteria bacterium]
MITLYDHPLSGNSYKVRLALSHLGVEYEKVNLDIFGGGQNSPGFIKLNPNKKIPVLVDGDLVIWESNAILLYLGNKYSPNRIFSRDAKKFGLISQWLFFGKTTLDPALARARFMTKFVPADSRNETELKALRDAAGAALQILDNHLAGGAFLAGDYSIADIGCFPYVALSEEAQVSLAPHASVMRWMDSIKAQPGYTPMG